MLVKAEERAVGRVDRRLYRTYLAAWGPFFAIPIFMFTMAMSERGLQVISPSPPHPSWLTCADLRTCLFDQVCCVRPIRGCQQVLNILLRLRPYPARGHRLVGTWTDSFSCLFGGCCATAAVEPLCQLCLSVFFTMPVVQPEAGKLSNRHIQGSGLFKVLQSKGIPYFAFFLLFLLFLGCMGDTLSSGSFLRIPDHPNIPQVGCSICPDFCPNGCLSAHAGGSELVAEHLVQHDHQVGAGRAASEQQQVHGRLLLPRPGLPGGAGGAGPPAGARVLQCLTPLACKLAGKGHETAHGLL